MFQIITPLIAVYLLLSSVDVFYFRKKRSVKTGELVIQLIRSFLLVSVTAIVSFVQYSAISRLIVISAFALHTLLFFGQAWFHVNAQNDYRLSGTELASHYLIGFLQPLVFSCLVSSWPFLDGMSLLEGIVLPFNMDGVKPVCIGFFSFSCVLSAGSILAFWRGRKLNTELSQSTDLAA
ncbi:MAG: hypothetical protein AB7F43_14995 [Bacteriovoracia bacterium]